MGPASSRSTSTGVASPMGDSGGAVGRPRAGTRRGTLAVMFERRLVTALVAALLGLLPAGVAAQSPSPAGSPTAITLEPFEDAAYGLRSVAPAGWDGAGMGIRMRARAPGDQTL